ncbi:MAG: zinc-dependent alcohol dehydrogenase family protein [Polyangiaceae bacterium]|nr:zinc-dependent alcohol dehydrogenase family protein [Polyangiaceae bacterium]
MKKMLLTAPGLLKLEQAEDDSPKDGEIMLAVSACGVCRTDLQIVDGDLAARRLPIVPGHQIVGRVTAIGRGVTGWSLGDRAGVGWLAWTCGVCTYCASGHENLCERAHFTGWDEDGGYATHARVHADFAFRLPDGFSDLDAAPLLCGGVIGYRSLVRSGIRPGGRLGLYGFGASALITMQVARHWGCRIFVATRSARERERAHAMGAEWTGRYDEAPPEPLDAAITFAPAGDVVIAALGHTAPGGTVAINAIHLDRIPTFSYDMLWRERNLVSVANYTRMDAAALVDLARTIPIRTHFETHPLADANAALERLREGHVDGSAVLVM